MRRRLPMPLLTAGLTAALLLTGCQAGPSERPGGTPAAPEPSASTPATTPTASADPCAGDEATATDGPPHREEVPLPEWWADQFPLPECGLLVAATQDDVTTSLEYEYESNEALLAAADTVVAELEGLGYQQVFEDDSEGELWRTLAGQDDLLGVEIDVSATTDENPLVGEARWPYPYLAIDFHDYR